MLQDVDKAIETYKRIEKSTSKRSFVFNEDELNSLGYQMIKENKIEAAIKLFELNVKEYPNSPNVYDSMGDAYRQIGKFDLAIKNYQKSLELNPANDNARAMLRQLKGDK